MPEHTNEALWMLLEDTLTFAVDCNDDDDGDDANDVQGSHDEGTSLEHDPSGALTGMLNTNVFENMRDPVLHGAVTHMRLHAPAVADEDAADASAPHSVVPFLRACLRIPTVVSCACSLLQIGLK